MTEIYALCERCNKMVSVKEINITIDKIFLDLKCGHKVYRPLGVEK